MRNTPKRLDTFDALNGTVADSRNLLILWAFRKLFYPVLILGVMALLLFGAQEEPISINWTDPASIVDDLLSPLAGIILAIFLRITVNFIGLVLTYPVLRKHSAQITEQPANFVFRFFDRLNTMRGLRSIRWTHAVRVQARNNARGTMIGSFDIDKYLDRLLVAVILAATVLIAIL